MTNVQCPMTNVHRMTNDQIRSHAFRRFPNGQVSAGFRSEIDNSSPLHGGRSLITDQPRESVERGPSRLKPGLRTPSLVIGIWSFIGHWSLVIGHLSAAPSFQLPTANHTLFERGQEEKFLVGTVGKPWTSGGFGCVRTEGWQMHEGLDIKCLQRDAHGEPADPVSAAADGTVAYINTRSSLSNYGNYIVLRHEIDGLEVYTLYAHLHEARPGLKAGQPVKAG